MEQNRLINSSSPYLRQHAQNPVDWYPWGEEALTRAREEGKPILVSIGYSSCHWCHVMERESFENDSIARIMNEHFINIKVDREERPDIDQIYMDAVQAMGLNGGWPLNVFLTSDQKPFYGGTYFPPKNWVTLLENIHKAYSENRDEIEASANELTDALNTSDLLKFKLKPTEGAYGLEDQRAMFAFIADKFDSVSGGMNRAPKFPMPAIWLWMLEYGETSGDDPALEQVHRTLRAMAMGGIFDQIGGGFARYSTDKEWLVPHFEKMLYDNGQLLRLYSIAYKNEPNPMYKEVVYRTIAWMKREMRTADGGFYSALDADSEGVEGKFYVWGLNEFNQVLGAEAPIMASYLDVSAEGNWEGHSILRKTVPDQTFLTRKGLTPEAFEKVKEESYEKLLASRSDRIRPGLDDKTLSGWNGIAITGLLEAYAAFNDPAILELARQAADYVENNMVVDGKLLRVPPQGKENIPGYLEDYAFMIESFLTLYEYTFDEKWLKKAEQFTDYTIRNFLDTEEDMFFFTDKNFHNLVVRKKEIFDNVIPSSNSQMAINLYTLGKILDRPLYLELSQTMLSRIRPMLGEVVSDLANWARLHLAFTSPTAEIVIIGPEARNFQEELSARHLPNSIIMGTASSSELPLIKGKTMMKDQTTIYVCFNKTCKLPVTTVEEALTQLQ